MQIDTVVYFQITDPKLYTYGIESPISAIENLTATTLRNIIGELELDETLTSRDIINSKMRSILDEATRSMGHKSKQSRSKKYFTTKGYSRSNGKTNASRKRKKEKKYFKLKAKKKSSILIAEGEKE